METFTLTNAPPRPTPWQGRPEPKHRQRKLLAGLDCLAEQEDLFATEGEGQPREETPQ